MQKTITERVYHRIHRYSVRVKGGVNTLRFWQGEESDEEPSRFGSKGWECPECGKTMHQGVKEDHKNSHEKQSEVEDANTKTSYETNEVSRGDLVDDYEIDWEEKKEEPEIEIQEADGGQVLKQKQLRKKWRPFIEELRESGEVVVTRHQHHGGLRGAHIVQRMKSDFKRLDLEMDVEFDIGESESYVRVDSI